jgi:hypothetical protein
VTRERGDGVSSTAILIEQYKLAEARRNEFGRQFMQTTGFVSALFAIVVSVIGVEQPSLLRVACGVGGVLFVAIAFLGYRLGKRQDDCEDTLAEIEGRLRSAGCDQAVSLPRGAAGFGARKLLVGFMVAVGVLLLTAALFGVPVAPRPLTPTEGIR